MTPSHSILSSRPVKKGREDKWRYLGHEVILPELLGGRTAKADDDGLALLEEIGVEAVAVRALAAAEPFRVNTALTASRWLPTSQLPVGPRSRMWQPWSFWRVALPSGPAGTLGFRAFRPVGPPIQRVSGARDVQRKDSSVELAPLVGNVERHTRPGAASAP